MSAQTTMTMTEAAQSLTGFEEQAIVKAFGRTIETLATESLAAMGRALVFVLEKRDGGKSDKDAKQVAMEMSRSALNDYFPDAPDDEIDPDEPETEAGKDDSPTG